MRFLLTLALFVLAAAPARGAELSAEAEAYLAANVRRIEVGAYQRYEGQPRFVWDAARDRKTGEKKYYLTDGSIVTQAAGSAALVKDAAPLGLTPVVKLTVTEIVRAATAETAKEIKR